MWENDAGRGVRTGMKKKSAEAGKRLKRIGLGVALSVLVFGRETEAEYPLYALAEAARTNHAAHPLMETVLQEVTPVWGGGFLWQGSSERLPEEDESTFRTLRAEDLELELGGLEAAASDRGDAGDNSAQEPAEAFPASGTDAFSPAERQVEIDVGQLQDYETLVNTFYAVDANTMVGSDQLSVEKLLGMDMTLDTAGEGPQILIYHTHSQEAFADSVPEDVNTGIVGVGEYLTQILTEQYGYRVLHHTGQYDAETRNNAYSRALPAVEELLAAYPSIQVIIDLHRDEVAEGTHLVTEVDGRPCARFMFFNGLSRTRKTGDIDYLKNENQEANLAFSFQMQLKAAEYYPGLTRRIYLKGYRYNMHLRPRTLLVELGAQNNTLEEAMNACDPLAHLLHMVLAGE